MIVRVATIEDSHEVFLWRNDETTRAMAFCNEKISWETHQAWFNTAIRSRRRILLVGVQDLLKVGICRFDLSEKYDEAEVSINLDPKARGKNLSAKFLAAAIAQFKTTFPTIELLATIQNKNEPSVKCFTKCGFKISSVEKYYSYFRYQG